ncbi:MAG: hypothetical protein WBL40_16045 [Terrimicrobiaceae bacterium]
MSKKSRGKVLTNFRVLDQSGSVYGSVNIPNEAVGDFLAHWKGSAPAAANAGKQQSAASALAAAFKRAKPRMSKAGVLRGCNG